MLLASRASLNSVAVCKQADSQYQPIHTLSTEQSKHSFTHSNTGRQQMSWYYTVWRGYNRPVKHLPTSTRHLTRATDWGGRKWGRYWCRCDVSPHNTWTERHRTGRKEGKMRQGWLLMMSRLNNHTLVTRALVWFSLNNGGKNLYIRCFKTQHNQLCFHSCSNDDVLLFSLTKASLIFTTHRYEGQTSPSSSHFIQHLSYLFTVANTMYVFYGLWRWW